MSERSELYKRWKAVDQAVSDIIGGAQSATVSDGNGSKSYTRANLHELRRERHRLAARIAAIDGKGRSRVRHIGVTYDA